MSDIDVSDKDKPKMVSKKIQKMSHKKKIQKNKKVENVQQDSNQNQKEQSENIITQIYFQSCQEEYLNETVDLITEIFISQEPVCSNSNLTFEDLRQFIFLIAKSCMKYTSIAVHKYKNQEGNIVSKVVSGMISCDQHDLENIEDKLNEIKQPQIQNILNIFDLTAEKCKQLTGVDLQNTKQKEVFHQVFLGTHKQYQKMGIGFALAIHNAFIAKKCGFQYGIMELTSQFSLNLCKLSNLGKTIFSVKYRQLKDLEQFKNGILNVPENLLDEEISIYFVNISDFIVSNFEKYVKDLNFIQ